MASPRVFISNEIKPGDIIGFSGNSWKSIGINLVTFGVPWWSISHVGIIGEFEGRRLLFESHTVDSHPCEVTGERIKGSQAHDIQRAVRDYRGKVWHYPLYRTLFEHERKRLNEFLLMTVGVPYDRIGAFRSGGVGFSWLESKLRVEDLSSLFCSEWCAAAHSRTGIYPNDNGARWNPNSYIRTLRWQGVLRKPERMK